MECKDFEKLLGKNISIVKSVIGNDFENKIFGEIFYYIIDENFKKDLIGMPITSLTILSNDKHIIESVSVHFPTLITEDFYEKLIQLYGSPNEIKIIDKRTEVSREFISDEDFGQIVTKNDIELKNGSFKENPLFIIWEKENFTLKIFMRHKQGISEMTFKSKK